MIANGLQADDRFAIWAPNIHQWISTAIGGMMAGGILVPLNTRYKGIEAGDILRRSEARLLFTTNGFLGTDYPALLAQQALPDLQQVVLLRGEPSADSMIAQSTLDEFLITTEPSHIERLQKRTAQISGDSISDILYTSGTTGAPKGVLSSHGQTIAAFDAWSSTVGLRHADRYLVVNPFFHSFGYKAGWVSCLIKGATCLPMAVFDADQTLALIEREKITVLPAAPTIFHSLLGSKKLSESDLSSLRCSVTGAASVPEQLVHDMQNILGIDHVFTAYGLTECPVVSITQTGDAIALIANTAGIALADTEIKVCDDQDQPVAAKQIGQIKVRGYNVMQAYFNNQQATDETIDTNGWLATGDIGWQDENGYIKVTDRAKDMYICGGFNCYPAEIENLLLNHPQVRDVAVSSMPDERLGEVGQAYIVFTDTPPAHDEMRAWAREQMANFKVPRSFIAVKELPRNPSGKVQKFKLAELPEQTTLR